MPRDGTLKVKITDDTYGGGGGTEPGWASGPSVIDPEPVISAAQLISPAGRTVRWLKVAYARPGIAVVVWSYGNDVGYTGGMAAAAVTPNGDGTNTVGPVLDISVPSGQVHGYYADPVCAVHVQDGIVAVGVVHDSMSVLWLQVSADRVVTELRRSPPMTPQGAGGNLDVVVASNGRGLIWACGESEGYVYHRVATAAADGQYQAWGTPDGVPDVAAFATNTSTVVWWVGGPTPKIGTVTVSGMSATPGAGSTSVPVVQRYRHSAMISGRSNGTVDLMCVQTIGASQWLVLHASIPSSLSYPDWASPYSLAASISNIEGSAYDDYTWLSRVAGSTYLYGYPSGASTLMMEATYVDPDDDWQWSQVVSSSYWDLSYQGAHVGQGRFVMAYGNYPSGRVAVR